MGAAYRELARHTDEWFSEADIEVFAEGLAGNHSGRTPALRERLGHPVQAVTDERGCRVDRHGQDTSGDDREGREEDQGRARGLTMQRTDADARSRAEDGTETGPAADGTGGSATSSRERRRPWRSSRPHRRQRRPRRTSSRRSRNSPRCTRRVLSPTKSSRPRRRSCWHNPPIINHSFPDSGSLADPPTDSIVTAETDAGNDPSKPATRSPFISRTFMTVLGAQLQHRTWMMPDVRLQRCRRIRTAEYSVT